MNQMRFTTQRSSSSRNKRIKNIRRIKNEIAQIVKIFDVVVV
jgi:hypothetical protein